MCFVLMSPQISILYQNKMANKNYQGQTRQILSTIEINDEEKILQRCPAIAPAQIK